MYTNINWIALVACGVAAMVVGFVWYSKAFLGKTWMKEAGVSEAQVREGSKNMVGMYVPMFAGAIVEAYVLSVVLRLMGSVDYMTAAQGAFWVWLGFIATTLLGSVLFERRSWSYYGINVGYHLVTIVVMSAILVTIR